MNGLRAWAMANPILARVGLRFGVRLAIAVLLVVPLQTLGARFSLSPNYGALAAVMIGLWFGGLWANGMADRWGIPREHAG